MSDENDLRDAASSLHLLVSTFSHSGTDQTADWSLDSLFYMCVLPYYREEREVRSRKICWEFTRKKNQLLVFELLFNSVLHVFVYSWTLLEQVCMSKYSQ